MGLHPTFANLLKLYILAHLFSTKLETAHCDSKDKFPNAHVQAEKTVHE